MTLRRLSAAALCFAILSAAPSAQSELPPEAAAAIDQLLEAQVRDGVPGLSAAIAWQNRIVYSKAFGMANLELQAPAKTTTAFRTASVAKPLTAAGVMTLVQAGKLDLDAPIRRYCPAWPEKHPVITARQLLGHLAGVRHYTKQGESTGTTTYFSIEESMVLFKDDPLLFEPGAKYSYSTYGYSILGCAIEGASGMPYAQYMDEHVFRPAGMAHTRVDFHYFVIPDRAAGYMKLDEETYKSLPASAQAIARPGTIYNAMLHDTSMKVPAGGLLSTAEDLARFGIALNTGALLPKEAVEAMWTEQKTTAGEGTGYGMGWGVTPAQGGIRRLSHSGNQAGASSAIQEIPELGVTIAVMTNLEDYETGKLSRAIIDILRQHLKGGSR